MDGFYIAGQFVPMGLFEPAGEFMGFPVVVPRDIALKPGAAAFLALMERTRKKDEPVINGLEGDE